MDNQQVESKKDFQKKYWRAVGELEGQLAKGAESEFSSTPFSGDDLAGISADHSRRDFLKVMGASFAMLGAAGCTRRPVEKIVPYLNRPESVVPGVANWYASTCAECDSGCGVLVKTREGRPLKFEGNPKHPVNQGGLCARGQASVLNLYDPDRVTQALNAHRKGTQDALSWSDVDAKIIQRLREVKASGGRLRVLTGEISGPSTHRIVQEFISAFGGGKRVVYEPLSAEEIAQAAELSYGSRIVPHYHFDRAESIVSFGADFLGTWLSPVEFSKGFAKNRKLPNPANKMSRFVAFESVFSLTGSNADERHRIKSGDEYKVAAALAHELIVTQGHSKFAADSSVKAMLAPYSSAAAFGLSSEALKKTAQHLWEHRGRSLVVGGGESCKGDGGVALEVVVNLLNAALENDGVTVDSSKPKHEKSSYTELLKLIAEMKAGQVDVLVLYKTDPLYTLPTHLGFAEALAKVSMVVDFSMHMDQTAKASDYVLGVHHHTETWGDQSAYEGLYSIQQPTIQPLYNTRGFEESLLVWGKQLGVGGFSSASTWVDYVKQTWKETVHRQVGGSGSFDAFWEKLLRDGFIATASASSGHARNFSQTSLKVLPQEGAKASNSGLTLALYPKISQYDGRNFNNGWLQELPDPVTKVTWDNYLSVSPALAKTLSVKQGDLLKVKAGNQECELPAFIQPGMHDQTVAAAFGYGKKAEGKVGGTVGVNVFGLATSGSHALNYSGLVVSVEKTGRSQVLATTQQHHNLEGRDIVREADLKEYRKNHHAGNEAHEEDITLWPRHKYEGYRWGMSIDLSACTGCSACMISCQSENNIPVVGKDFAASSREMHWLRIDRYYTGNAENPDTVFQPMLCQHCENAPCETVCPVLATMHDHEGLNQQVYNRCVGTRYCANNCPYKVRRFNWFTFTDVAPSLKLAYNPEETVRTRGVMEKCTFCMQRIRAAKDDAKDMGVRVKDGDLKTACQQSCPTDAIHFGDINDKNSKVSLISKDPRGFHVLSELNVRPSITYLTKIRNKDA